MTTTPTSGAADLLTLIEAYAEARRRQVHSSYNTQPAAALQAVKDALAAGQATAQAAPENIRGILARCRDFIDTTKAPAYPAGADLADEIDVLLAAPQPSPAAQGDALDAARYRFLRDGEWRDTDLEPFIRLQLNTLWDAKIDAAMDKGGAA